MKKYIYKNKKTGTKIESDKILQDKNLVLVMQVRDGQIKSNDKNVIKK